MFKNRRMIAVILIYCLSLLGLLLATFSGSRAITVISENRPILNRQTVVIDAGHGGIDGGATSCTGVPESNINLDIALRLNDLMHLLGMKTVMIRTTDISVYVQGSTIAQKKVSDLKERVRIINETNDAFLISIHQNAFSNSQYYGAQVFFADDEISTKFAQELQNNLVRALNPCSNRKSKKANGIYLMQHIECPGVLVECGFLSNEKEEALLRNAEYQKKLCCVITSTLSCYLDGQTND